MNLVVEVFSMDPISGYTAFALCDMRVTYIGSMIQAEGGITLNADQVTIKTTSSEQYGHVVSKEEKQMGWAEMIRKRRRQTDEEGMT